MPSFVGPVLAAHIAEFGRYPANKGIERVPRRRRRLARPPLRAAAARSIPSSEVLVLNGTREGLFLGGHRRQRAGSTRRRRHARPS